MMKFEAVTITRKTAETEFQVVLRPRTGPVATLDLPNRLLAHFIDHFSRACGVVVESAGTDWPGSYRFDHVLCEDLGQLLGRGIAAIHDRNAAGTGVPGRGSAVCVMDDAESEVAVTFEGRPSATWTVPQGTDIDRFVDSWYDPSGRMEGSARGTNLRQFLDGFAIGAGAGLSVTVRRSGNLHHFYETVFRALGDAVAGAIGTAAARLPGDTSGLAGRCDYTVEVRES
jgi:imidazoleglycerol phosphate dehydratase HisB